MLTFSRTQLNSILALGCHADDIEIGCGGTILRLIEEHSGLRVHWVVLSGDGPRAEEARASGERFLAGAGEREITVHDFRDRFFPFDGEAIKRAIHAVADKVTPDLVFTHRREDMHQDHRLVAELTWHAFRNHLILEYEIPKYEGDLGQPNVFFPLTRAQCERKIETLQDAFPSQHGKPWFDAETFWALLRLRGLECHSPTRYAEAFHARKVVL